MGTTVDMRVKIAGVEWKNPVTVASGTFGSGEEFSELCGFESFRSCDHQRGGKCALAGKSDPASGRNLRQECSMPLDLQNPGIDVFCQPGYSIL